MKRRRPLLAGRELQLVLEPVRAVIVAGALLAIVTERLELAVLVGERQAACVVAAGDVALGDDAVLDLEQVGEVGVDLERHADAAASRGGGW